VAAKQKRELSEEPAEERDEGRLDALRDAIGRLPAHLANVVVLRDLSRLSYQDVGRTLGIDPATARVYRRHAVVKLAELLDEGEES
jgi:DNA-directed RNA polymerase specialized sigma24 family protein